MTIGLMMLATLAALAAAIFAGLSWREQKRRTRDGAESERRLGERVSQLAEEVGKNRDAVNKLGGASERTADSAEKIRAGTEKTLKDFGDTVDKRLESVRQSGEKGMETLRVAVDAKLTETVGEVGKIRDKTGESLQLVRANMEDGLSKLRESVENRLDGMGRTINTGLKESRESSERKLEQIRHTVDEQLQTTLEKKLAEQFGVVSVQLENVHKGLGEMRDLSSQVGSLQRVLTSSRDRGQWGEVVLKDVIRQILPPDHYQENVEFDGGERVEFAIKVPVEGRDDFALLPVDSKFPMNDYERLVDAEKKGEDSSAHRKALLNSIRKSAKDIRDKYIRPPRSTDYAFLFLPTEGLYAVAAAEPGFLDEIQQTYKVRITGPDIFSVFLSAVRMGFQLFAAGQRANEIREVLGAVKTEFGKFGGVLERVKKNLQTAANNIEKTETRVGVMTRKLKEIEALPEDDAAGLLGSDSPTADNEEET